jgi:hypothetical protein
MTLAGAAWLPDVASTGNCTGLREHLEEHRQGYVLRVPSSFRLTLARGLTLTCAQTVRALLDDDRRWEVRSAGKGSKGQRWYAWAQVATASRGTAC